MDYRILPAPDFLKNHIHYFWVWEHAADDASPQIFRPVADGHPGLIFQASDNNVFRYSNGERYSSLFVYGQTVQHRELHAQGNFKAWGICFKPNALKSLFGLDADELTDSCAPLTHLFPQRGFSLPQELQDLPSATLQIERMTGFLQQQLQKEKPKSATNTEHALAQLLHSKGHVSLKALQDSLRLSERALERKFRQEVGISPKLFSRICRFQASLQQLKSGQYDKLSDIAFENGYADQSHFIRVFREFSGFTPEEYRKQTSLVENLSRWEK